MNSISRCKRSARTLPEVPYLGLQKDYGVRFEDFTKPLGETPGLAACTGRKA